MIARDQNPPPDTYDQIEAELAAEDERVGVWPPPQWWAKTKTTGTYTTSDGVTHAIPPGTVVYATDSDTGECVELTTITDWPTPDPPETVDADSPLIRTGQGDYTRDHADTIGRPLTRREGFWLTATIATVIVGLLGLAWFAVWVLGGVE